jgi:DNA-binding NarL/FixJ family response regulator
VKDVNVSPEVKKMTNRPRISIADDHTLVAELCKKLLETKFDVVGMVSHGRALLRAADKLRPDVIVVDIAMPVLNGLDAGRQVKEMHSAIKLIYLTMNTDVEVPRKPSSAEAPAICSRPVQLQRW